MFRLIFLIIRELLDLFLDVWMFFICLLKLILFELLGYEKRCL